jgi:hypothetical protein
VWRLLTEPRGEDPSLRDLILADWRRGMEQLDGTGLEDLLFQKGVKGLEALRVRTTMLETLSTNMDLIQQDIELLLRTIILRELPTLETSSPQPNPTTEPREHPGLLHDL